MSHSLRAGSSALRNPHPKSPCVVEERRAGLGQTLPVGVSRVQSDTLVNDYIRLGRGVLPPRTPCQHRVLRGLHCEGL